MLLLASSPASVTTEVIRVLVASQCWHIIAVQSLFILLEFSPGVVMSAALLRCKMTRICD